MNLSRVGRAGTGKVYTTLVGSDRPSRSCAAACNRPALLACSFWANRQAQVGGCCRRKYHWRSPRVVGWPKLECLLRGAHVLSCRQVRELKALRTGGGAAVLAVGGGVGGGGGTGGSGGGGDIATADTGSAAAATEAADVQSREVELWEKVRGAITGITRPAARLRGRAQSATAVAIGPNSRQFFAPSASPPPLKRPSILLGTGSPALFLSHAASSFLVRGGSGSCLFGMAS